MGYCTRSANLIKQQISFFYLCIIIDNEDFEKLKAKVSTEIFEEEKKQIITG